ncbi:MAG: glycosyltransferase family 39 protein [Candidatus Saccharibacteria bacterium]|nr:glycosyltransferase family 39 protein [Candidatus Saccharibacteria bacterium]
MKKFTLPDSFLYRWRYQLGYGALILLFVAAITAASFYAPGGLSQAEIDAISVTNRLNFNDISSLAQPNLPFHLLQKAAFAVFGVSVFTIKLPSLLLAIITAFAMFFLLRRWFKPGIAILALIIMTMTGQLIFIAQHFSADIIYITHTALILLFGSLLIQRSKRHHFWHSSLALTVAFSLYTPYFWYINLGLLTVAVLHPHTRHSLFGRKQRLQWLPALGLFSLAVAPLVYLCLMNSSFLQQLIGIASLQWDILHNASILAHAFIWPFPVVIGSTITPLVDIAVLALVIFGLFSVIRQHYTARSYMIAAWLLFSLPLLLLQPTLTSIIAVPLFILLAVGLESLLREWYSLFPKNPYARGTGLILIVSLIGVMVLSGADRYINGYRYMPDAVNAHSLDLQLIANTLDAHQLTTIIASETERPIYDALAARRKNVTVTTDTINTTPLVITNAARGAGVTPPKDATLERIIVNARTTDADRFYYYK